MVSRKPKCQICNKVGRNKVVPLLSGQFIHETCHARFVEVIEDKEQKVQLEDLSIRDAEQEIISSNSFFKTLFGGRNRETRIAELNDKIAVNKKVQTRLNREIKKHKKELEIFYDFWPEYPPDWEDRRNDKVSNSNRACEECGSGRKLHVHHIKPIARGGGHLEDNLEVLCEGCHSKHHPWMDGTKSKGRAKKSVYRIRLELINKALSEKKKVKFQYTNYSGEKSKRVIRPQKFVKPGSPYSDGTGTTRNFCIQGHCALRGKKRVFTISKMMKMKLV